MPFSAPYQAMSTYVTAAQARAELWRTMVGLILAAVFGVSLVVVAVLPLAIVYGGDTVQAAAAHIMAEGTERGVIGLLYSFVPQMLGLLIAVALLMRRGPLTLLGPIGPALRNSLRVAAPLLGLGLVTMVLSVIGDPVQPNRSLSDIAPWAPAALLGLLIQTGTEELFFRGYLQQQLAARFPARRWVWLLLPSVLFGLLHYSTRYSPTITAMTMIWAAGFGLAAADLTARTGNLGAALALHFTNNVSAILLVSFGGTLGGLSLYTVAIDPTDSAGMAFYLGLDALSLTVAWLLARVVLRR